MFVVGHATPEPNRINQCCGRAPFTLADQFGLMRVDSGIVVLAVDTRNMIKRVVLYDRETKEAAVKDIRGAN